MSDTISGRLVRVGIEPGEPALTTVQVEGRDEPVQLGQADIECNGSVCDDGVLTPTEKLFEWLADHLRKYMGVRVVLTVDAPLTTRAEFFDEA